MGASVMGLFRHSLSIFGGDYVICRIFLQSTRTVVIRRTYKVLPARVGIRAHAVERLVLRPLRRLKSELLVGTPHPTLALEGGRPRRIETLQH